MFNVLFSVKELFLLSLLSFFILLTIRLCFIEKKSLILLYHTGLLLILTIASIGAGSVQNDGYQRLEQFIALEKSHQLKKAKKSIKNYDTMFQIDLHQFKNSDEFRKYLQTYDSSIDTAESFLVGWIFVVFAEISILLQKFIRKIFSKKNKGQKQKHS